MLVKFLVVEGYIPSFFPLSFLDSVNYQLIFTPCRLARRSWVGVSEVPQSSLTTEVLVAN